MTDNTPDGTVRLQGSGVGTIIGGLAIAVLSIPFAYTWASAIVLGLGVAGWLLARQSDAPTPVPLGIVAIGAIGAIEAGTTFGIGLSPIALAALAVAFGLGDIVIGGILHRRRAGRN